MRQASKQEQLTQLAHKKRKHNITCWMAESQSTHTNMWESVFWGRKNTDWQRETRNKFSTTRAAGSPSPIATSVYSWK